jgi:CheY-like chemotaxis protein
MAPTVGRPKILYVEDNPSNRLLARAVLESAGYNVVEAEDGLAGIAAAVREQPALILLDVNLPRLEGWQVATILRSLPGLEDTAVVAVTAYASEEDRDRAFEVGCDGYLTKPIDVDAFPGQVAGFLAGKRGRPNAGL